jgi:ArsR family transcriptional regulator, arsenate/arsenite/antimonite-responsive transcriptional repressor
VIYGDDTLARTDHANPLRKSVRNSGQFFSIILTNFDIVSILNTASGGKHMNKADPTIPIIQTDEACCAPSIMSDQEAEHFASLFKAISHPVRVKMLDIIHCADTEICVCDVEACFHLSQPTISHHLKILRDVGLIESEQRGLWVYHRIRPATFATVQGFLEGFR